MASKAPGMGRLTVFVPEANVEDKLVLGLFLVAQLDQAFTDRLVLMVVLNDQ